MGSRARRPTPCPACDAWLPPELFEGEGPVTCPACETTLEPIRAATAVRRFAAAGVDLGILLATAGPLQLLLAWIAPVTPLAEGHQGLDRTLELATLPLGAVAMRVLPFLIMSGLYVMLFSGLTGRTPGQRLLRLRLVDREGGAPGLLRAGIRTAALALGMVPGAVGPLWAFFDLERRTVHDLVAGTYLVRDAWA